LCNTHPKTTAIAGSEAVPLLRVQMCSVIVLVRRRGHPEVAPVKWFAYLRVDTTFNGGAHGAPAWNGDLGHQNRYRDYFASRARMALTVDTRTATEYGVVRAFGQLDWSATAPSGSVRDIGTTTYGNQINTEYLFIQFAGFTFGKSSSAYSTPWNGYPGNLSASLLGGNNTDTGLNNIQYTAQFGNGVSGSIGLDDPSLFNRTNVFNLATGLNANGVTGLCRRLRT
jgi:Porin subfamily